MHQWVKSGTIWINMSEVQYMEQTEGGTRIWWGNGRTIIVIGTPEELLHLPPAIDYGPKEPKESQS